MKAVVFHDVGDIRLEQVPEPQIENGYDAIVRLTSSAICGTDRREPGWVKVKLQPAA
jgi:threonine dehydrogenase-like Zn-dependent dehydrogenase